MIACVAVILTVSDHEKCSVSFDFFDHPTKRIFLRPLHVFLFFYRSGGTRKPTTEKGRAQTSRIPSRNKSWLHWKGQTANSSKADQISTMGHNCGTALLGCKSFASTRGNFRRIHACKQKFVILILTCDKEIVGYTI